MSKATIFYLLAVFIVSFMADFGFQLGYYYLSVKSNPQAFVGVKTLWDYKTGFIGDMLLLPVINCLIVYIFLTLKITFKKRTIMVLALLSLLGDFLIHALQGVLNLTNWSMPKPFLWNPVSLWHMISFFFQILFILSFFYAAFAKRDAIGLSSRAHRAGIAASLLILVFLVMFFFDYRRLFGI